MPRGNIMYTIYIYNTAYLCCVSLNPQPYMQKSSTKSWLIMPFQCDHKQRVPIAWPTGKQLLDTTRVYSIQGNNRRPLLLVQQRVINTGIISTFLTCYISVAVWPINSSKHWSPSSKSPPSLARAPHCK
jgi:hypothetical protein